jgi:hypothetical protein
MLDEFALSPDPMPWSKPGGLRIGIQSQHEGTLRLLVKGYIKPAGLIYSAWVEETYVITDAGRKYWKEHIEGGRSRPPTASRISRWTHAQKAVARSPIDVWDLARVPWTWDKAKEHFAEWGVPLSRG